MIGSERFTTAFASGANLDDPEQFRRSMMKAAGPDLGFALVFLHPGTKDRFICPLTARTAKKADEDERERTGNPRATHPCGRYHVFTDSASVGGFLRKRIDAGQEMPNVAVELGASRMMVVDLDTEDEVAAWEASWAEQVPGVPAPPLTVTSPGKVDRAGQWVHKNGGHLWLDLAAVGEDNQDAVAELVGTGDGTLKHPDGWTLYYRDRIVLVPPSQRPEGRYEFMAAAMPVTSARWLFGLIAGDAHARKARATEREQRRAQAADRDSSGMIEWAAHTSWDEQLVPAGWTNTGKPDSCGCTIYTAPGDHGSPKSATAHSDGCSYGYDADEGHLPLHVWTDNPPDYLAAADRKTFTLFQHNAWLYHGGDMSAAAREAGVVGAVALAPLDVPEPVPSPPAPPLGSLDAPAAAPAASPGLQAVTEDNAGELAASDAEAYEARISRLRLEQRVEQLRLNQQAAAVLAAENRAPYRRLSVFDLLKMPDAEPLIEDVYHADSLSRVVGSSYSGKSFVVLDQMLHVAMGWTWAGRKVTRTKVLYVFGEGSKATKTRFRHWCRKHGVSPADLAGWIDFVPESVSLTPVGVVDLVNDVTEQGFGMVVFDTQHSMMEGDENSAADFKVLRDALVKVRETPGRPCVVLVHHTGHENARGRGSSSGTAMLDTEILVTQDGAGVVEATVTKDKLGQEGTRVLMRIVDLDGPRTGVIETMDPLSVETQEMLATRPDPSEGLPAFVYEGGGKAPATVKAKVAVARLMRDLWVMDPTGMGATHAEAHKLHVQSLGDKEKPIPSSTFHVAWKSLVGAHLLVPALETNPSESPKGPMVWDRDRSPLPES